MDNLPTNAHSNVPDSTSQVLQILKDIRARTAHARNRRFILGLLGPVFDANAGEPMRLEDKIKARYPERAQNVLRAQDHVGGCV
jgi:hypothetical protein